MKDLYRINLNGSEFYMVREKDNTVGIIHQTLENAQIEQAGKAKGTSYAVSVGNEVMSHGNSLGFMKNVELIKA